MNVALGLGGMEMKVSLPLYGRPRDFAARRGSIFAREACVGVDDAHGPAVCFPHIRMCVRPASAPVRNNPTSYRNEPGQRANQKPRSNRLNGQSKMTLFPIDANGPNGTGGVCGRGQSDNTERTEQGVCVNQANPR
jgi:hypothetical protein